MENSRKDGCWTFLQLVFFAVSMGTIFALLVEWYLGGL